PPSSSLLPYTTLFRSHFGCRDPRGAVLVDVGRPQALRQHRLDGGLDPVGGGGRIQRIAQHHGRRQNGRQGIGDVLTGDVRRRAVDRKSTRLNSSHVKI